MKKIMNLISKIKNNKKSIKIFVIAIVTLFSFSSQSSAAVWTYYPTSIPYEVVVNSPDAPTNVVATPNTCSTRPGITVSWNPSAGATSYNVLRSTTSGSGYNLLNSTTNLSYSDIFGLTSGITYYYVIQAVNSFGTSANSAQASAVAPNNCTSSPSGSVSATDCTIAVSASSCTNTISWTTANLTANPTAITRNTGSPSSFTPSPLSSGSQSATLGYGSTTFYLYHNAVELAQDTALASCATGSSWNGLSCQASAPADPSVSLNVAPPSIFSGDSSTLSWTSANVSSCIASASPSSSTWTGSKPTSSSYPHESTGALTVTTVFTLSCNGSNGPASDQATVIVNSGNPGGVDVTLTATPDRIDSGDSSLLTWSSSGATSCYGLGFSTGGATSNGAGVSVSPTTNTTYTINCVNGPNSASDQATVNVKRKFLFIEF